MADGIIRESHLGGALEHLDFAIAELHALKMQPSLERALERKNLLKAEGPFCFEGRGPGPPYRTPTSRR